MIKSGDIVTVDTGEENASNTYIVFKKIGDNEYLLHHPLVPDCFILKSKSELNKAIATIKDSVERCLDFVQQNKHYLDYNMMLDLEALCLYFAIRRKMTPKQKQILSAMCGLIASIKLNNNVTQAMSFITKNTAILDDYNLMWVNNFKGLFNGTQPITSKKQRAAIFNIAGFVFAELENPVVSK